MADLVATFDLPAGTTTITIRCSVGTVVVGAPVLAGPTNVTFPVVGPLTAPDPPPDPPPAP